MPRPYPEAVLTKLGTKANRPYDVLRILIILIQIPFYTTCCAKKEKEKTRLCHKGENANFFMLYVYIFHHVYHNKPCLSIDIISCTHTV